MCKQRNNNKVFFCCCSFFFWCVRAQDLLRNSWCLCCVAKHEHNNPQKYSFSSPPSLSSLLLCRCFSVAVSLFLYLSFCLCLYFSFPSVALSFCLCVSVSLSVSLSFLWLSVFFFIFYLIAQIRPKFIFLVCIPLFVCLSVCLSFFLSVLLGGDFATLCTPFPFRTHRVQLVQLPRLLESVRQAEQDEASKTSRRCATTICFQFDSFFCFSKYFQCTNPFPCLNCNFENHPNHNIHVHSHQTTTGGAECGVHASRGCAPARG